MSTSLKHEGPLLLLGERPEMLVSLLGLSIPAGASVGLGSADFTQAVPLERRADAVITIEEQGRITSAFVVEVQLGVDLDKHFSWPLYLASLHARVRCRTVLVVLASYTVARQTLRRSSTAPYGRRPSSTKRGRETTMISSTAR